MDDRYGIPQRESESVEFKLSMAELNKAVRSGCAMLNSIGGGSVYIGVRDDGEIIGIEIGDRTHDRLNTELSKLSPIMRPSVTTLPVTDSRFVIKMEFPGNTGPYRFDSRPYIRISASDHEMPEQDYQRLVIERYHSINRWENGRSRINVSDLDTDRILSTFDLALSSGRLRDPGHRDTVDVLQGFGLIEDGNLVHAAAVLFGKPGTLMQQYPQCQVKLARFDGTDKRQFRDNRQYHGNIFDLIRIATEFVAEHNPISSQITSDSIQRRDTPTYHPRIVREALVNAFAHRDYAEGGGSVDVGIYDDRLEITSTGGLRFGLTVEDLLETHPSRPWNETIARVLRWEGSFENWGSGTNLMLNIARDASLPAPEFINTHLAFTVRLVRDNQPQHHTSSSSIDLDDRVLELLATHNTLSLNEMMTDIDWVSSRSQLKRSLERLRASGKIALVGRGRGSRWTLSRG